MKTILASMSALCLIVIGCTSSNPSEPTKGNTNQDYYPTTIGSKWVYNSSDGGTVTIENTGTQELNGKTYTSATQSGSGSISPGLVRNDGRTVYVINSATNGEISYLEYSGGAGQTWSYSLNNSGTETEYLWKVRSIGMSLTVPAGTYDDILIADLDLTFSVFGSVVRNKGVYYFSKKYGIVKVEFSGDALNQSFEAASVVVK